MPKLRLPGDKWGQFQGVPGYSNFAPANPVKLGLKPGETIPWVNGTPSFAKWSQEINVKGLTGDALGDRNLAIKVLAEQKGITQTKVGDWLTKQQLRIHHFQDDIIQIVPNKLHKIPHQGSASKLRNQGG